MIVNRITKTKTEITTEKFKGFFLLFFALHLFLLLLFMHLPSVRVLFLDFPVRSEQKTEHDAEVRKKAAKAKKQAVRFFTLCALSFRQCCSFFVSAFFRNSMPKNSKKIVKRKNSRAATKLSWAMYALLHLCPCCFPFLLGRD
jgi:hypothetical protein